MKLKLNRLKTVYKQFLNCFVSVSFRCAYRLRVWCWKLIDVLAAVLWNCTGQLHCLRH